MEVKNTRYGLSLECIENENDDLEVKLNEAINTLPSNFYIYRPTEYKKGTDRILLQDSDEYIANRKYLEKLKNNNYFVLNNNICIKKFHTSKGIHYDVINCDKTKKRRLTKFIELRDQLNTLVAYERNNADNDTIENARVRLNELYDDFVKKENFLNNNTIKKTIKGDVETNKILALEKDYFAGNKNGIEPIPPSAKKADIFTQRTISSILIPNINTSKEALMASLAIKGKISLSFLRENSPKPLNETLTDLIEQKLIFVNHNDKGDYVLASQYLSGNVKQKYAEVKAKIELGNNDDLLINLESLENVLPKDIKGIDISAPIGSTWIPIEYYKDFFKEKFDLLLNEYNIYLNEEDGKWKFYCKNSYYKVREYNVEKEVEGKGYHILFDFEETVTHALQRKPIQIYKKEYDYENEKERRVLDVDTIRLAEEKVQNLKQEFNEWLFKDYDRRIALEKIYNEKFNTNIKTKYDGSHINLSGFNQNITLRPHQKDAIWRAILEKNVLFDHQVGAGKTYIAICSIMEQKRMNIINKALIVVPNHLVAQWNDAFYNAYPNANILVPTSEDMSRNGREQFYSKIANNNFDAIIMPHSQLKYIPVPHEIIETQINKELAAVERIQRELRKGRDADADTKKFYSIKDLEKKKENLENQLLRMYDQRKQSKSINFSELGIDALIIDESQEFKNLSFNTSMSGIKGIGGNYKADKANDLYMKTIYMHENGYKVYFLTGTPISNSITELYSIQRYLQPEVLEEKNIEAFDAWASIFGEVSNAWELDSSGINYKIVSRFNKFQNLPELSMMYQSVADIINNEDIMKYQKNYVPELEGGKPINIIAPRSEEIANYIGIQDENGLYNEGSIIYRMENFRENPTKNNMLSCTNDARKAGLDYRLIEPLANDYEESKVNNLIINVINEYKTYNDVKGTQLIFCDLSTPKKASRTIKVEEKDNEEENDDDDEKEEKTQDSLLAKVAKFDIYSDILKKLVKQGIPQNEIAFIHDATTNAQRRKLFNLVNNGEVRILIGSTIKMGTGTNVQQKVVALHHLDCAWRPSDIEQRRGRVIRQGNEFFAKDPNFKIKEFRYATEQTYDARMWQIIEQKALFIEQFRNADSSNRVITNNFDIGSADAAIMKAEASGNPLILLSVKLKADLDKEESLYKYYVKNYQDNEDRLKHNVAKLEETREELRKYKNIKNILDNNPSNPSFSFAGKCYVNSTKKIDFELKKDDNSDENKEIREEIEGKFRVNLIVLATERKMFDYRGLTITAIQNNTIFSLKGPAIEFYISPEDNLDDFVAPQNMQYKTKYDINFNGFVKRLNNFFNDIDKLIDNRNKEIMFLEKEIHYFQNIVGDSMPVYEKIEYLNALRDDYKNVIDEIDKKAKDKNYISDFTPKSYQITTDTQNQEKVSENKNMEEKVEVEIPKTEISNETNSKIIENENIIEQITIPFDSFDKNASIEEKIKVLKSNIKNIVNTPRASVFLKGENHESLSRKKR